MPNDKEHLASYPTSIGINSGVQKLLVDGDVAVFKIEHDLLADDADNPTSTDAADSSSKENFLSNISSEETVLLEQSLSVLPQFLPDSVQCLKLKTHFTEVIEELRMRRIADKENEDKVKQLVRDKQILESKCEEAVAKARLAEQERDSKVDEVKKSLEHKLKDLLDQQGRHVLALEVSEKESKLLKDEIRTLQLSKYSLEKQIRELQCKLQLQSSSLDSSLTQFAQLESVCRTVSADLGQLTEQTNRLDSSVKEATKLNQQLNHTIHHQKLAAADQTNKISQLQKDLAVARASHVRNQTENQLRVTENEQLLKATQQDLTISRDEVERLRRQLQDKQHELNKTLELLTESHSVVGRHRETIEFLEQQSRTLEESVTEMTVKCSSLEQRLTDALKQTSELQQVNDCLRTEHADQVDAHISQLKTVEERCAELVRIQSDLEALNSIWAQRNVQLTEQIDALNLKMNKAVADASAETDVCDCISKGVQASCDCTDQLTQVVIILANNGTQTAAEQKLQQSTQTTIVNTRSIKVDATATSLETGTQTLGDQVVDGSAGSLLNLEILNGNNMTVNADSVPESLPATPDDIDLLQTAVVADCSERDRQVSTAIFFSQTAVGGFKCSDKFTGNEARAPMESTAIFLASRPLADLSSSVNSSADVSYIGSPSNDETSKTNSPMPCVADEESRIDISVKIPAIAANCSVEFGSRMNLLETLPTAELHLSTATCCATHSVTTTPCGATTATRGIIKPSSFKPPFVSQKDDTLMKEMHVSSWKRDEVDSLPNHGTVAEMGTNMMYNSHVSNLDAGTLHEKYSLKVTSLPSESSCISKPATELTSTAHVLESQHSSVTGSGTCLAEAEGPSVSFSGEASVTGGSLNEVVVAGTPQVSSMESSACSVSVELEPGKDNTQSAETQLAENSDASIACETFALESSRLPETGNESAIQSEKNDKNQNYVGFNTHENSDGEIGETGSSYGSLQKGSVSSIPDHGLLSSDALGLERSNSLSIRSTGSTGIILPSSFMFPLRQPLFAPDTLATRASNAELNSSNKLQQYTASVSLSGAANKSVVTSDTSVAQSRMNFSTCIVTSLQTTTSLPCFAPSLQTRTLPTGMPVGTVRSKLLRPSAMQQQMIDSPCETAQNYTGYQELSHADAGGNGQILGAGLLQLSTTAVCNTSIPTNISTTAGGLSTPANLRKPFSSGRVQSTGVNLGRAPSISGVNKQTACLNQSGSAASAGSTPLPCTNSRCTAAPTEHLSPSRLASDEAPTDRTTADGIAAAKGRSNKRHLFSSKGQLMDCSSEAQTSSPNVNLSTVWPPASAGRGLDRTHRKLPSILHHDTDVSPLPKKAKKVTFMKPPLQLTSDPAVVHVTDADCQVKVHAMSEQPENQPETVSRWGQL